jgi:hydroxyethylthiazole kinase
VINIGKLSKDQIESMKISSKTANETNTPIVLDPVGVGVTELRNKTTMDLIENYDIAAIRGNISEIKAIAKLSGVLDESNTAKGVDVNADDIITEKNLKENGDLICELANKLNTVILASGPLDILSDGETTVAIDNGDDMMPLITGSGCMLSSIVGSCIGGSTPLEGSLVAILAMNLAGEKARAKVDEKDEGTGSFRAYLIDYIYKTNAESLINESNIRIL